MTTTPLYTKQFCIKMYCHYAQQIWLHRDNVERRKFLEEQQQVYIYMYSLLVDFHLYAEQLGL